jgi:hypothetical protein
MARFRAGEEDNYGGNGGHGFFSLANDKDVASVRFMYNGIEDVEGFAVHQVEIGDKKRYVNCLREYNQPMSACPFCEARKFQIAKLFIPVYVVDEDQIKFWERGKKFFAKISSLCGRYPNLVSHTFDIERHGKKGDTNTTYEIYETGQDDTTMEDLPEVTPVLGTLILDKTVDDMNYYLDNGCFPNNNDDGDGVRRRTLGRNNVTEDNVDDNDLPFNGGRQASRRTPAGNTDSSRRNRF